MVGIDDEALTNRTEEGCEDCEVSRLPGHADEDVAETRQDGDEDQRRIADAGEQAARAEGVQVGVMGVFRKEPVELQRPDPERQPERHLGAEDMAAEAAKTALIIALVETGALLEQLRDRIERQQYRDQRGRQYQQDERHDDHGETLRRRGHAGACRAARRYPPRSPSRKTRL